MGTTHIIHTNFGGETHSADFWGDGDGQTYAGYCTNLRQLRAELRRHFGAGRMDLITLNLHGERLRITSDQELLEAVEDLPHRGVLSLTAVKRGDPRPTDEQYEYESDSDSDDESDAGMDDDVGAIVERFDQEGWAYQGMPWDTDASQHPLRREPGVPIRDDVRHLQYLLTRLGYMPLDATSQYVGSYQRNTERAVRRFREEHGLDSSSVYDKKAARVLAQAVRRRRAQGHQYL